MRGIVVLQARTSSTRLPCKVMLPVNKIPIVVMAALRASNTGRKVIVVTSKDSSDDDLVALLELRKLNYYRGDLNNVLDRTVQSLVEYQDETIVVRLTADNISLMDL